MTLLPPSKIRFLLICLSLIPAVRGETLEEVLRSHRVPVASFVRSELDAKITSWAASKAEDPFLLAYYDDDGSGFLNPPLRVIRYDRSGQVRRGSLAEANAEFEPGLAMHCLGSVNSIRELPSAVVIETHKNPSAGCVLVLSTSLELKAALSGWVLGVMGSEFIIVHKSMVHFAPVHAMRITVYDLRGSKQTEVYPPSKDEQRDAYSKALAANLGLPACGANNSPCDPHYFENGLKGRLAVNDEARVFGFVAEFRPRSFGKQAEERVGSRDIAYVFRLRGDRCEHRSVPAGEFERRFGFANIEALVANRPNAPWEPSR